MTWVTGACAVAKQIKDINYQCQDSFLFEHIGDNKVIAVLADGAGSAPKSKEGAEIAVNEALACLKTFDLENLSPQTVEQLQNIPEKIRTKIREKAEKTKEDPQNYATTLIAAVFMPDCLIALQVGDGFLVSGVEDEYDLIFSGKKGEYVNETNFVTDDVIDVQCFVQKEPINFVAIATDGLEHVAIDHRTKEAHIGFFKPFDLFLKDKPSKKVINSELEKFLKSERLQQRSNDDRTLFVAKYVGE
jgi:hypothetical protein